MGSDIVIGAAAGYGWPDVEPWAVSLVRSGFKGRKVVISHSLTKEAEEKLNLMGFDLVESSSPSAGNFFVGAARHFDAWKILRVGDYERVFFVDVRDLVFQRDPSVFAPRQPILLSTHPILHKHDPWSMSYVESAFPELKGILDDFVILNGGIIAGDCDRVKELLFKMYLVSRPLASFKWGIDQTVLNLMVNGSARKRNDLAVNCCIVAEPKRESEFKPYWLEKPPVMREGLVYPAGSAVPYVIVHQYDRNPEWEKIIRERYRYANNS